MLLWSATVHWIWFSQYGDEVGLVELDRAGEASGDALTSQIPIYPRRGESSDRIGACMQVELR